MLQSPTRKGYHVGLSTVVLGPVKSSFHTIDSLLIFMSEEIVNHFECRLIFLFILQVFEHSFNITIPKCNQTILRY